MQNPVPVNPFAIFNDMEERRAQAAAQAENSARPAFQHLTYKTQGTGQQIIAKPLPFQAAFAQPPSVLTGSVMNKLPGKGWAYPQITAGVYKWKTNKKGYVEGAYIYFIIECRPLDLDADAIYRYVPEDMEAEMAYHRHRLQTSIQGQSVEWHYARARLRQAMMEHRRALAAAERQKPEPEITHHFSFQGVALKDLPDNITTAVMDM